MIIDLNFDYYFREALVARRKRSNPQMSQVKKRLTMKQFMRKNQYMSSQNQFMIQNQFMNQNQYQSLISPQLLNLNQLKK